MDRLERADSPQDNILSAFDGLQAQVNTAMPGIIQSFNPDKQTCVVQPALKYQMQAPDGTWSWVTLPLLVDCPVQFPGGGGVSLTFPVKAGDECLVIFAQRCIDAWWQSGGIQTQLEFRMHDWSDGCVLLGFKSVPSVIPGISTTTAQLRTDDGLTFVEVDPVAGNVNVAAAGNATVTAAGDATVSATTINLNGVLIINGTPYLDHLHDETTPGAPGDHSGPVVP